ncbi:MAG: 16S rRNA processing protein RimM [Veillonellaceae bacterium]|nr:16S rRNA processing protein RimM [Veillonellaceae bacterium]
MKDDLIAVAKILSPHGVRGEVKLLPLTDFPHRFAQTEYLLLADRSQLYLESVRMLNNTIVVKFRGMDIPEAWIPFRNKELFVTEDNLMPLPPGQYYIHQIVGLEVVDEQGKIIGRVAEVLQTGSNDVYVIKTPEGDELLLAAIVSVVREIDIAAGRMSVIVPEYC